MAAQYEKHEITPVNGEENPPPVPPRTSSISAAKSNKDEIGVSGRGSYYDNYPVPAEQHENNDEQDQSFYNSSSDESEFEEENENHIVTGLTISFPAYSRLLFMRTLLAT